MFVPSAFGAISDKTGLKKDFTIETSGYDFKVFLNGTEIFQKIKKNDSISFIVLEFNGTGHNTMEIIGTTYLPEFSGIALLVLGVAFSTVFLSRKFKSSN